MIPKSGHRFSEKIMLKQREREGRLAIRLAWFVGLWLAGVLVTAAVAYGLRLWLV